MTKTSNPTKTSGKPRVVFFGSGPVAARSLSLLQNDFDIEAIITKPTTIQEMQDTIGTSPVFAVANKTELDTLINSHTFSSNLGILIDFGIIVSQSVINTFPLGIINSHFSLLPELRGADPIAFAILSGQATTGVSLMLLVQAMDEGPILSQRSYDITTEETTPSLTNNLINLSHELLTQSVPLYISGAITPQPQSQDIKPTYTRKLNKQDGILDFNKSAEQLEREVRAYYDWPKSRTTIAGKDVIVTKAYAVPSSGPNEKPGDLGVVLEAKSIYITTANGSLWIERLKPAGKKEMTVEAFLAGHKHLPQK